MSLREAELTPLVAELAERLVGERLTNAWQPARDHVVLGFMDGTRLLLVPRGPDARLHTMRRRPKNPQRPFSFQGALRAHLSGRLEALEKQPGERVVVMRFTHGTLHLRLTGRSGGLWLEHEGRILAAYDGPAPQALPELPPAPDRTDAPRMAPDADGTWDDAVARFFAARIRARRLNELRIVVGRQLRRESGRLGRLVTNLEDDLERAGRTDEVRTQADTLAAYLTRVTPGPDHVDLPSVLDPDRTLRIPLLPGKSPAASMERLYAKARRLERMGELVLERLESAQRQHTEALRTLERLDALTLEELEALHNPAKGASQAHKPLPGVITWIGPRGERVLVGKDVKANRRLTFQVGRAHDVWMHLRGKPGAHVLLPLVKGKTAPLEHLLAAAQITVQHAGLKEGDRAEVQYTTIRNIRSIPGSDHAKVRVHDERVLLVTRDPAELSGWSRQS